MNEKPISFVLDNGLTVIHAYKPGSGIIGISMRAIAGSVYESLDEAGIAHFLEHVAFEGSEKYPSLRQLAALIDGRGGVRNGITNKETVEYIVKVLNEDVENAFEYLSQIVIYPLLPEESIGKQKKIIEQEIYRFMTDPENYAPRLSYSRLFPGLRAGGFVTGTVEEIKRITHDQILSYMKKTHVAKNMVLSVCGDISTDDLRILAKKYFGSMASGEMMAKVDLGVKVDTNPLIERRSDLSQAFAVLAFRGVSADDPDRYALGLIRRILGQGKTSRLQQEIREKRALAYIANADVSSDRNMGLFNIVTGMLPEKLPECIRIIREQLDDIVAGGIQDQEIAQALISAKAGMVFGSENALSRASTDSYAWCSNGVVRSLNDEYAAYKKAANIETLTRVAKRILSGTPSIVVVGPTITPEFPR